MTLRLKLPHPTVKAAGPDCLLQFRGYLVDLSGESSNHLFRVLSDWELHLASFETELSRCDNDNIVP